MARSMDTRIEALSREILKKTQELSRLRRQRDTEPVENYTLTTSEGDQVRLSELFGEKRDLIVIHNMGKSCVYCTMWADGFTGFLPHLQDRAAFVVSSPDPPEVQREFAASRGWSFPMVSTDGTTFTADMGFVGDDGYWPGVSAFRLQSDGSIVRTNRDVFGPMDSYNSVWHLIDLLGDGAAGWEPRYSYS